MKVTLAIPNYNGLTNLKKLIPRVLEEGFDAIYVLDDGSSDGSVQFLKRFEPRVQVISGSRNRGPGGNRNRIMRYVSDGVIMFLDADMELVTRDVAPKIRELFADPEVAIAGGFILNKSGDPMGYNFGPPANFLRDAKAEWLRKLAGKTRNKRIQDACIKLARPQSNNWGEFIKRPPEQPVGWVAEGNFCVRAEIFKKVGGFNPKMRFHETHDLSRKVRKLGYSIIFSPAIVSRHLEIPSRPAPRRLDLLKTFYHYLAGK